MAENAGQHEGTWDVGWEGHERAQLLRMAALPLPLKLRWLEEAQVVVDHLRRQREHASGSDAPSTEMRQGGDRE
jgi:hypothetical protein